MSVSTNRSYLEWVDINQVIPNPLNPRRNDAVRTEEIQAIIKKRGWEEPLTVYKKGKSYVVLAGHRRLFAARTADLKEIPVFVTEAPKDQTEELERIGSLQSGRVNWTALEWANYTYGQWTSQGKPPIPAFAKHMTMSVSTVKEYIAVIENYSMQQIEPKLMNGTYSFKSLYYIQLWINKLKEERPSMVQFMTENYIREVLLKKLETGKIDPKAIRQTDILKHATDEDLRNFIYKSNVSLQTLNESYNVETDDSSFQGQLIAVGTYMKRLKRMKMPMGHEEKLKLAERFRELGEMLNTRAADFERIAEQMEKEKMKVTK